MASLIDELISILTEENKEYQDLVILSHEKTNVIVKGDIDYLKQITEVEQNFIARITKLEKKRTEVVKDIGTVLCKDPEELTVKVIIDLLKGQDDARTRLASVYDELRITLKNMTTVNELNKNLVNQSLELVQFDLNLLQNAYQEPEMANYSQNAYSAGYKSGGIGSFDTKR